MYPPIFAVCSSNLQVQAELGALPCRLYLFGEAPKGVATPYAVWQVVFGSPQNYLGKVPDIDKYTLQIDIYANSAAEARDVAEALRGAIEPEAYVTSWRGESREPDTNLFRYSFDVDWMVKREDDSTL